MQYDFTSLKATIVDIEAWLSREYAGLRSGRATPVLLDRVLVESYGSKMPLSHVGSVSIEDVRTLRISPWDKGLVRSIESAIAAANLGVSTASDESGVRVIFPEMTEENRKKVVKIIRDRLEDARIRVRTARDEIWGDIQERERNGDIPEDDKFRLKNDLQNIVDDANAHLEAHSLKKEKEILE